MTEAWTYEQVVMLCETDGVPLPTEFIEWVAEKMTRAANDAIEAAGASEGQAEPIPVPTIIDRSHANQAYVTYGFRDEAMCTEFINATNSHRKPLYTHPSAEIAAQTIDWERLYNDMAKRFSEANHEIAALRERIAGMEKDAERYRWMRDWYLRGGARREIHPNGHIERTTAEIIDQGIDAAIAGAKNDD